MKSYGLRVVQLVCVLFVGFIAALMTYVGANRRHERMTATNVVILLMALYAGVSSFTFPKWLNKRRIRPVQSRSTPYSRWRAGHIVRLNLSTTMAIWAMLLKSTGGPGWMAYGLCGLAIALL